MLFYTLLSVWFLTSAISGRFIARMCQFVILCYLSFVFCMSLLRMYRQISQSDVQLKHEVNFPLLVLNLTFFILQCIFKTVLFCLIVVSYDRVPTALQYTRTEC